VTTAILDYGSGNLRSAEKAFQRMAAETGRGGPIVVTADPETVLAAERVVLPGVGAFADCARGVEAAGLREALEEKVVRRGAPFLGVCVGMQLMATVGREHGDWPGFGWIPGEVRRLTPADPALKVPHMGWNAIEPVDHPIFAGVPAGSDVYFVHSYHLVPENQAHVLATADHGGRFAAAVGRDAMVGTQFHPEKSQAAGLRVIANFLGWRP
jgi:glutamine amidotransferase